MGKLIKLGISIGDINGVGLEIILKSFKDKDIFKFCVPVIFGNYKLTIETKRRLGIENILTKHIKSVKEIKNNKIYVLNAWKEDVIANYGSNIAKGGKYALKSLEKASQALKNGEVDIIVTAPINKHNIQSNKFNFPGHTEYLEHLFKGQALMIMVCKEMRIGLVTGHVPLKDVHKQINEKLILHKLKAFKESLKIDFGIHKPKIAVLGLNPHAGDNNLLGQEESQIIQPAIDQSIKDGLLVFGPYSADGFFGSQKWRDYDGVLAMYHDQGLIPFKTFSFGRGVNYTSGLMGIRTSPDHGTAFDIAGQNKASASSFRQAIYTACDIFKKRQEWKRD